MSDISSGTPGRDEQKLAELGYKQELQRAWSGFTNFAISFTIISVLAGTFTSFFVAWNSGGPVAISIAVTGPGRFSIDRAIGWDGTLSGVWWGVGVVIAAAVVSFVSLAGFRTKPPPQPAAQAE